MFERQEPSSETWGHESAEERLLARVEVLGAQVHKELERQGFPAERIEIHPFLNMRFVTSYRSLFRPTLNLCAGTTVPIRRS